MILALRRLLATLALASLAIGCTIQGGTDEIPLDDVDARADVDRDTTPGVDTAMTTSDVPAPEDTTRPPDLEDVPPDTAPTEDTADIAPDVPPDLAPMPGPLPAECAGIQALPWNEVRAYDLATWDDRTLAERGCFARADEPGRTKFFAVNLPAGHGVEFTMRRLDGRYYMYLAAAADHCAPVDPDACEFTWNNGFFGPDDEEVSFVFTNGGNTNRVVVVRAEAAEFEQPVSGDVEIETRVFPIAENASCEQATELPPDTTVTSGFGTVDEVCGWSRPHVYYELTLPPMSRVDSETGSLAYAGGQLECGCFDHRPLRNATDAPQTLVVEVGPDETLRWTAQDLEPNARCEDAIELTPAQPGTGNFDLGGDHLTTCSTYGDTERPLFWTLEIPPRTRARVTATTNDGGADYELRVATQSACNVTMCDELVSMVSSEVTLELDNPGDAPITKILNVATGFLPPPEQQVTVTVAFEPLP